MPKLINNMKITFMTLLMIVLIGSNVFAAERLLLENFDDRSIDSRLTPRKVGTLQAISPPEYSLVSPGRGGTGYCYSSGSIRDPYLEWMNANIPKPWPSNEMYVSYWMRYPTFTSTDSNENFKFFYPHWDGTNSYVVYSMVSDDTVYYSAKGQGTMLSSGNWLSCPNQADGNWHHYEFYVNFSQGISRFWYDGILKLNHNYGAGKWTNNVYYIAAPCQDSEEVGTFTRQVDDWEGWDGMPSGVTPPTADTIPPSAPSSVTVNIVP